MKQELIIGSIGTAIGAIGTALQTEQVLRIIALVLTIIGALMTYIVMPLIAWFKKAKKDGKITIDEVEEAGKIITDGTNKVKDEVDKQSSINENHKE